MRGGLARAGGQHIRDTGQVVAIDLSVPYASRIRRALPHARIVLDHFLLVLLANTMLTDVRQRVQREQQGRREMKVDPAWAHRRLLLRAGDELTPRALARRTTVFALDDPTYEINVAWACKELLHAGRATDRTQLGPGHIAGSRKGCPVRRVAGVAAVWVRSGSPGRHT